MRLLGQPSTGGRSTLRLPVHCRNAGSAGSGHAEASAWTQNSIRDVASDVESCLMLTCLCLDCVASITYKQQNVDRAAAKQQHVLMKQYSLLAIWH